MTAGLDHYDDRPLWRYLRLEIPVWLWCLAEVALLVPFALAVMAWARYWPPLLLTAYVFCLMLLPFNLIRLMSLAGIPLRGQQWLLLGGLLAVLVISVRGLLYNPSSPFDLSWAGELLGHLTAAGYPFWARDFSLIALILYCWWRGMTLLERPTSLHWVGLQFRVRALLFAPLVIFLANRRLVFDMTPFLLVFGFAQLAVVAFARANEVQRQATGLAFHLRPAWMGVVAAAALLVVTASGAVGYISATGPAAVSPQEAVLLAFTAILLTLGYLLAPFLLPFLDWLAGRLIILLEPLAILLSNFAGLEIAPLVEEQPETTLPEPGILAEYTAYLPAVIFLLVLGTIMVGIILFYQRVFRERPGDDASGRPAADLTRRTGPGPSLLDRLRDLFPGLRAWHAARSIRRIYHQMTLAAGQQGAPREPAQTPYEYLPYLARIWPDGEMETRLITTAYVRVRYGQLPESPAELAAIQAAWHTLEKALFQERMPDAPDP